MRDHLQSDHVSCPHVVDYKGWRLVLLDSVIVGEVGGRLARSEIELLEQSLDGNSLPTLISLHHQPVPVGSAWLDEMGLENANEFQAAIADHPEVKGLLWGHVHQQFDDQRNGVRLMSTPSTCVQFAPGSDTFSIGQQQPGFRLLVLLPDGQILSEVMRTAQIPQGLEVASAGYE
jgi:Icc protein